MEDVYQSLKLTRQASHKALRHSSSDRPIRDQIISQANFIRSKHRKMGCRKLANRIKMDGSGRDKTERLLLQSGFRIARKIKHVKTTHRQSLMYFPNLIRGLTLKSKNRLIQTDITYYIIGEHHYYIVFIIDVYTRLITGYNVSDTLKASENIKALQMALNVRSSDDLSMLIHHSDKGSQYIDKDYLNLIAKNNIRVSMCDYGWENAYCERLNRTIKEEYLDPIGIKNFTQLRKEVNRAVQLYNEDRGHKNLLNEMSPSQFERYLTITNAKQHPEMELYSPPEEVINKKQSY